jgi:hypothetical protein
VLKHIPTPVQINQFEMKQVPSCQWKKNENSDHQTHKVKGHIHIIQLNMINYILRENGGVIEPSEMHKLPRKFKNCTRSTM